MIDIPYEAQQDTGTDKRCGAASLCMVYRSLGIETTQDDVWPGITKRGVGRAYTQLIAVDALKRGFASLIIKAKNPWRMIQRAAAGHHRVILNHRVESASRMGQYSGHYSVLVGSTHDAVVLHDPKEGPRQTLEKDKFLQLWERGYSREVMGNILIVIGEKGSASRPCHVCGARMASSVNCRLCKTEILLDPSDILGCPTSGCSERLWQHFHCPHMDCENYEMPFVQENKETTVV